MGSAACHANTDSLLASGRLKDSAQTPFADCCHGFHATYIAQVSTAASNRVGVAACVGSDRDVMRLHHDFAQRLLVGQ